MDFSEKIKLIRKEKNLTVENLAKKLGIKGRTISSYERGEHPPSISFAVSLCKELNVNPSWFLLDKGCTFINPMNKNDINDIILQNHKISEKDLGLLKVILDYLNKYE